VDVGLSGFAWVDLKMRSTSRLLRPLKSRPAFTLRIMEAVSVVGVEWHPQREQRKEWETGIL